MHVGEFGYDGSVDSVRSEICFHVFPLNLNCTRLMHNLTSALVQVPTFLIPHLTI